MNDSAFGNPFPGLRPFEGSDNVVFFGRDEQVEALLERLCERRFVAVVGTSASGKSSLVRAGLLPALHGGFMAGAGARWRIALLRPGNTPAANLAVALESAGVLGTDGAAALRIGLAQAVLDSGERGLIEVIAHAGLRTDENVLIVVDQFEELFRFTQDRDRAAAFVKLLLAAASDPGIPTYVLLTMRSDFLGDCAQFRDLPETINDGLFLVPRLAPEELREVIEGPVGVAGAKISPLLVNRLLNEIGDSSDQLPVLQHALMQTWEVWIARGAGDMIGIDDFDATGGLAHALSKHGDTIFEGLPERLQPIAEKVFKALTDLGSDNRGIRRPTPFADLPEILGVPLEDVLVVVEEFRRQGRSFVMPPSSQALEPTTVVDIAHESLMRIWDRLQRWVHEEAESAQIYRRLADAARLRAKDEAALLVDPQLTIAATWREHNQPTAAWGERYAPGFSGATAFLTASLEERDRQRQVAEERERREQEEERRKFEAEERAKRDLLERDLLEQQNMIERTRAEAAQKLARQTRRLLIATALVAVLTIVLGAFAFLTRTQALIGQSRFLARDATAAVDAGSPVTGILLALAALPKTIGSPLDRPFVPEAEYALEYAFPRQQELMDLGGHEAAVWSAAFSPDDRRFVSASDDRTVRVWDAASGAQIAVLRGHDAAVFSAAFSPDGRRIVSASYDKTVRVWNAANGAQIAVLRGHDRAVRSAMFSPDGQRIVSASRDRTVRVWDAVSGVQIAVLRGREAAINSAAFSPDGRRIVGASDDNTVQVWDAASGTQIALLRGFKDWVGSAAFSPDGRRIVSASADRTVRVWDAASGAQIALLRGHDDAVDSAAFSPDGRRVVSASADKTVRVWDAASGAQIALLRHNDWVRSAAFSHDGRRIVSASDDKTVRVWDGTGDAQTAVLHGHDAGVYSAGFSPDARRIVSASRDRTVRVWDAASGEQIALLRGHRLPVRSAAFSPDGRRIVSASYDKTVRVWDAASGAQIAVLRGHERLVRSAAFSPDGRRIVSASADKTVRVWDAVSGARIAVLHGHKSAVYSAAFSPDGRRIVSTSYDETVRVWDATSGVQVAVMRGHDAAVYSAAFSPDGRRVVSASFDKTVRVWDAASGDQIAVLRGHNAAVWSASYSPDGRRIVSASRDKTVRVWDAASGAQAMVLRGHDASVYSAGFSPDGRRIVSASYDKTVRVWPAATLHDQALIDAAHSRVPRQLTAAERAQAYL